VRGRRRPPRRRRIIRRVVASVTVGVMTLACIWLALPSLRPRVVIATSSVRITPLPTTIGFHDPSTYFMSDDEVDQTFDKMLETNVKAVRLMIPWAGVE
jgi:polysaccharide biosynthesis protein PslG